MSVIDEVMRRPEFEGRPPVLVDVGASSEIHAEWRDIAKYSICVAFDADDREMGHIADDNAGFLKLYVFRSIVTDDEAPEKDFYLTRFPQCSSALSPRNEAVACWAFAPYFDVERRVRLKNKSLASALAELGLDRVDWFKTDSQGIDLRLFKSLGDERIARVIAADFEPGIIDAYEGEDKLFALMGYMSGKSFWMSDMTVKGNFRARPATLDRLSALERKYSWSFLKKSPGWAEVSYLNTMANNDNLGSREYLLAWVAATVRRQHMFAHELALAGHARFGDAFFRRLAKSSFRSARPGALGLAWLVVTDIAFRAVRKIAHLSSLALKKLAGR